MLRDAKYLLGYLPPALAFLSIYFAGAWSFLALIVVFGIIPWMDMVCPQSAKNLTPQEEQRKLNSGYFDCLLYLNLPILFGVLFSYFHTIQTGVLAIYEIVGITIGTGIAIGTIGINVAHELGHRSKPYEQLLAKMLLMTALYMHFFIEHNRGHHRRVATGQDPASARFGEMIYTFWIRSMAGSYLSAWRLETERLRKHEFMALSRNNQMIWFQAVQIMYLLTIGL
ncbi:MAG: hypothetical protein ETSY2_15740 [Candidatus Entotheonella gemina]|uniref:Fatty acid desaturase domain-containing protein n=1 Tax=Candidatus Entotheonella gemina TaxID=1429439 RepID=W4M8Y9_9BACT|nr:MAG: hypothetical protein ETSY2_15740 [Candidatus Entotheonella gemina]